ncbi:MAG: hypothetical protein JO188_00695 [Hyphomicrobiales bacterium]|nr:hypothetical protein [Hyphomicrobiales bacterium]
MVAITSVSPVLGPSIGCGAAGTTGRGWLNADALVLVNVASGADRPIGRGGSGEATTGLGKGEVTTGTETGAATTASGSP